MSRRGTTLSLGPMLCGLVLGCADDAGGRRTDTILATAQEVAEGFDSGGDATPGSGADLGESDANADGDLGTVDASTSDADEPVDSSDGGPDDILEEEDLSLPDAATEDIEPDTVTPVDAADGADLGTTDAVDVQPPDIEPSDAGPVEPIVVFDNALIADTSTINCVRTNPRTEFKDGVVVDLWDVSYTSYESLNGVLHPILIRGFAAKPASASSGLPGVVQAHGLGGFSKPEHATGLAALLGVYVIAYTGPGGGTDPTNTSEGLGAGAESGYHLFDTLVDPRESWFWSHAVAGMRGLTCLEVTAEVDSSRLGMTGFSAGGVVTLISAAVDPRIDAAVPLSGTGGWAQATQSPTAWQHPLLAAANLTIASPEWSALLAAIDSTNLLGGTTAKIFMVNGTSDEFFPMPAHLATFDAISPSVLKRTSFAGNFDHGCYALSGVESAATIEARADLRAKGAQRALFGHTFGTNSDYATIPEPPTGSLTPAGLVTLVAATVDEGGSALDIKHVHVWWSNDDGFLWGSLELDHQGGNVWGLVAAFPTVANTQWYIDVEYESGGFFPEGFSVSSRPSIPPGLVSHIRAQTTCI